MTLLDAEPNKEYIITGILGEGNARRRLLDMGFTLKSCVYVSARAPLSGAVLVVLRGASIALRNDAASAIEIKVC